MKLGELLDKQFGYQVFEYGEEAYLKVFDPDIPLKRVVKEYEITSKINQVYIPSVKAIDLLEIDDAYGIVYEKVEGITLLYSLEDDPQRLDDIAKSLAKVHADLHKLEIDDLLSQDAYLEEQVEDCDYLTDEEKAGFLMSLEGLPHGQTFCHGNYHLNHVIVNHSEHVTGFSEAFTGHPMSDVAKAVIIMSVPRFIEGAKDELQTQIKQLRLKFVEVYLDYYASFGNFDKEAYDQFYKLMAVTRLNVGHDIERDWLLNVIRS
ncbi:hypothetical protein EZV73_08360 [Acidaminobacter sp. JC074]|uniref:phosphotransferase family protein n=1 Tax=Acidaminobacter sp. JC074 TaxID=2530199 RepID=UPI001F100644|nr:aminoglycoside phosphotransferase family protein [Acidaminobacter sp. JC074]MCH4887582.1 hypothetical protein [Acidaminobacter sp. JC074]